MYAFENGDDSKNKLKGISKTSLKNIKFDEYKKCLDAEKYQKKYNNYIFWSLNREM